MRALVTAAAAVVVLIGAATPAIAFQAGDVYWAPGSCDPAPPCPMYKVDVGLGSVTPFVSIDPAPGQFAWEPDRSALFVSQYDAGSVLRITTGGAITTFATGITGATGLLMTSGGTLLAVSYADGAVYDITAGGDFSAALPFASGFNTPRNLLERSDGSVLLVDQTGRAVFDITAGGDFSSATPFANGFLIGVYDLVEDLSGHLFISARLGVFDITAGGNFGGASPFASGRFVVGLTIDPEGRLLASEIESGAVYDVSAGGDFSAAAPVVTVPDGLGDSALDTAAFDGGVPHVPALRPLAYLLLASLLLLSGRRSRA